MLEVIMSIGIVIVLIMSFAQLMVYSFGENLLLVDVYNSNLNLFGKVFLYILVFILIFPSLVIIFICKIIKFIFTFKFKKKEKQETVKTNLKQVNEYREINDFVKDVLAEKVESSVVPQGFYNAYYNRLAEQSANLSYIHEKENAT